ncbi:unnamed protein product [Cladocopium goreaui]|uniref:Cell differentiation protein RCD1-like n=1 Tax=Cladocopium goreaui TaxID=2562237 RepID=A0A9P1CI90_9DINO|nr:unnamed protein product [Cladocopium goreaui]
MEELIFRIPLELHVASDISLYDLQRMVSARLAEAELLPRQDPMSMLLGLNGQVCGDPLACPLRMLVPGSVVSFVADLQEAHEVSRLGLCHFAHGKAELRAIGQPTTMVTANVHGNSSQKDEPAEDSKDAAWNWSEKTEWKWEGPVIGGAEIGVHKGQGLSPIVPTIPTGQRNRIPVVWCFVRWTKWTKWTNQTGQIGGRGVNTGAVLVRLVRLVRLVSGDADEAEVDRVEEGTDDGSMVISESEMSERATVWACDGL